MKPTGRHIMLFEKEKGLERIMSLLLKQADFRVTLLSDPETALGWLASYEGKERADILIIDVSSSDREGTRILQHLQGRGSDLPVIIISPYGSEESGRVPGGYTNYRILSTPFSPEELLDCIEEISMKVQEVT